MKYLITAILLLFTLNANAQQLTFGTSNVQVGASNVDGQESVFAGFIHDQPVVSILKARIGVGAALTRFNDFADPYKNDLGLYFRPSIMLGTTIPVDDKLRLGVFTGYQSNIGNHIRHSWNPLSVSIEF